jgi:hypothetical protein
MNGQAAGAGAESVSVGQFYLIAPWESSENPSFNADTDSKPVVLIAFFTDLTTWLVEMGFRGVVATINQSISTEERGIVECILFNLENLRNWEWLSPWSGSCLWPCMKTGFQ